MKEVLDVYLYGRLAATLKRRRRQDYQLIYEADYLNTTGAVPLSTRLPLRTEGHAGLGLLRVLEGFLPDRTEVLERWARDAGLPDTEAFGLIAAYGEDIAGAAVFVPRGQPVSDERSLSKVSDPEIATRIRAVRADAAEWVATESDHRFSLAGAQGKFALAYRDEEWHDPSGTEPSTHIFKPGIEKYPDSDVLEHVTMELARSLGLPVATSAIRWFDDERILVVDRFDRVFSSLGVERVHQEDFAQATGTSTLQKYEKDGGPSVTDIVDVIRANVDPSAQRASLLTFGASLVFAWLVAHNDGHAKNYSLRLAPDQIELAPLYDLNTLLPYLDPRRVRSRDEALGHELELAFSIDGDRTIGSIGRAHWRSLERTLGLPRDSLVNFGLSAADQMVSAANAVIDQLDSRLHTDRIDLLRIGLFVRRQSALRVLRGD
jgi:serine/threonine-protein kinase HipA